MWPQEFHGCCTSCKPWPCALHIFSLAKSLFFSNPVRLNFAQASKFVNCARHSVKQSTSTNMRWRNNPPKNLAAVAALIRTALFFYLAIPAPVSHTAALMGSATVRPGHFRWRAVVKALLCAAVITVVACNCFVLVDDVSPSVRQSSLKQ